MNADLAWLDMIDRLETGTKASKPMALASLAVSQVGQVTTIRTYERGVLVSAVALSSNVLG